MTDTAREQLRYLTKLRRGLLLAQRARLASLERGNMDDAEAWGAVVAMAEAVLVDAARDPIPATVLHEFAATEFATQFADTRQMTMPARLQR